MRYIGTNAYDKSPLNYIGGKYKILPQIMEHFPTDVDVMVDLFAGGCDVCCNFTANEIYANDINNYIIEIYKKMQGMTIDEVLSYIDATIETEKLSIDNQEAYLAFRKKYNQSSDRNPLDLKYTKLILAYSFLIVSVVVIILTICSFFEAYSIRKSSLVAEGKK